MADAPIINLGENSAEHVAFKLMNLVATAENKTLHGPDHNASREWIIKTYIMCRTAVAGHSNTDHVLGLGN